MKKFLRRLVHWLYTLLPYKVRVKSNELWTDFGFKHLGKTRGRQGPVRPEDRLEEHWGYMISGELRARVYRGLEAEAAKLSGFSWEVYERLPIEAKKRLREQAKKFIVPEEADTGSNTVTDAGVAFLVDDWDNNTADITNMQWHAMGTGGSPPSVPAVTATALVTEVESRVDGVSSQPAANQLRSIATITATAPRTINEWGLLSASTVGTLWSTRWFTAISLATSDAIEFTYTLTITSFTA